MRRLDVLLAFAVPLSLAAAGCGAAGAESDPVGVAAEALLSPSTTSLDFGMVARGSSRTLTVTLTNTGTVTDDITSITPSALAPSCPASAPATPRGCRSPSLPPRRGPRAGR